MIQGVYNLYLYFGDELFRSLLHLHGFLNLWDLLVADPAVLPPVPNINRLVAILGMPLDLFHHVVVILQRRFGSGCRTGLRISGFSSNKGPSTSRAGPKGYL